jgi:hypothetical protein
MNDYPKSFFNEVALPVVSFQPDRHRLPFEVALRFLLSRAPRSITLNQIRRGGRAVEGARLESVYTGNRIEGSNPSLSAIIIYKG